MPYKNSKLAAARLKETVTYLWTSYAHNRANAEVRNRLVEHYTPLVQKITTECIRQYRIRETDTAMGDALLLLVMRIIPQYDGQRDFHAWALYCIRQKMIERKRQEARRSEFFRTNARGADWWPDIAARLVRPNEPGADIRFADMAAAVPAREGAVLWMRFYRNCTDLEIARSMNTTTANVRRLINRSLGVLRELAGIAAVDETAGQASSIVESQNGGPALASSLVPPYTTKS